MQSAIEQDVSFEHRRGRALQGGNIHGRRNLIADAVVLRVPQYADDLQLLALLGGGAEAKSERIITFEVRAGRRLVDHHDPRRRLIVALSEPTPADEGPTAGSLPKRVRQYFALMTATGGAIG